MRTDIRVQRQCWEQCRVKIRAARCASSSKLRSLTTVCIPLKSRGAGLFNPPRAERYLCVCDNNLSVSARKLQNSPERHRHLTGPETRSALASDVGKTPEI